MAAKQLDATMVEKKFSSARATPDSIQSVALWTLTHKSQCDQIVAIWLSVLKTSKIEKRLTLFYICNEIVQTCRKKHAIIYKDAFKEVLRDAAILARDKSISDNVKRIFKIWQERGTYDKDFVQELTNLLTGVKVQPSSSKLLSEFNPATLRDTLKEFVSKEVALNDKKKSLTSVNVELNSKQIARLFKDRSQGKQYSQQIKDSLANLIELVDQMEKMVVERVSVIDRLECALLFYETQYGEAKIVTNAYRNFGNRIKNLQKKLEEQKKILPSPASPVPSPPTDAPSPVDSLNGDCNRDNMETVDMDLSDEDATVAMSTPDSSAMHHQSFVTTCQASLMTASHDVDSMFGTNSFVNVPPPFRNPNLLDVTRPPPSDSPRFQSSYQHRPFNNSVFYNQFQSPQAATQYSQYKPTATPSILNDSSSLHLMNSQTASMDNTSMVIQKPEISFADNLATSEVIPHQSLNAINNSPFATSNSWKTTVDGHFINSPNSYTNSQTRFSGTQEVTSHPFNSMKSESTLIPEGILNSRQKLQNTNTEKLDPFSLLDKLLAQSRSAEKTSDGSQKSLFDILVNNSKPAPVTTLTSASSTPLLDDIQRSNEQIQFNGSEPSHQVETISASESERARDPDGFSTKSLNQINPGVALEKNILSTVDIKPDVFEILKSIVNSTKQSTQTVKDDHSSNPTQSLPSKQIQEDDRESYATAEPEFVQPEVPREPLIDSQDQYYSQEQYYDPSYVSENENDSMQDRNFSPSPVVPPVGPLVAPKCFFEIYAHVSGGNFGGPEDGEADVAVPSAPDVPDDSTISHGPPEQEFDCYDNYENHDDYYPGDDLGGPHFNPEVCEEFGENLAYNDHRPFNENNFLPPRPNFNYRPDFNRNHFNRNVGFPPPRPVGFHNFPRQRFQRPRFFGRGYFPR